MKRTTALFWCSTALYLVVGLYVALGPAFLLGDSLSRVSAARSVLFSNDPHLAAIGFIFTPLTAVAQLPAVIASHWWTSVTSFGLSGVVMSAPFMAGAVVQIHLLGRDRAVPAWMLWALTVAFACTPMIVFYGANGMSEAPFLFLTCWAARRIIRWTSTDDVHDLAAAGIGLGVAYLARYDSLAAAASITVFVFLVTLHRRGRSRRREMLTSAALDAVVVVLPSVVSFFALAFTSWVITGQALQQFSSNYGNANVLAQSGGGATDPVAALAFSLAEVMVLGPVLPLLLPVVAVLAWRRKDLEPLAAFVLFGSIIGFAIFTYVGGQTFPFLRFYIAALPLTYVVAFQLLPPVGVLTGRRDGPNALPRPNRGLPQRRYAALAMCVIVLCPVVTTVAMASPTLAPQEYALQAVVFPERDASSDKRANQNRIIASFDTERQLAEYLDSLRLPPGSILMDTVYGFAVFTATASPRTFVIPSDQDFTKILNRPASYGVRYLLTVPNAGRGESDAINRRYPTIYETGADIATLELQVPNSGADQPVWRLYRVLS